ncbi:MAG TPA: MMPL family transporter [Nocardioidaceae bacterium]|nr:MMPL family transporter [Nocardioidaceae bacterium]
MARSSTPSRRWLLPAVVVLLWLVVGGPLGSFAGQLASVQENDNAAFLPESAESTVAGYAEEFKRVENVAVDEVAGPIPSEDGTAAQIVVPIETSDGDAVLEAVEDIRAVVEDAPPGLTSLVGGQGGILGDFVEAFGAIDGLLLGVALLVVLVILLVVYRAPVLPLVVLLSAVLGLGVASAAIYGLASSDLLDLNGQSQGMLFILAVGAATDYSLLIVARFREELRDHESQYEAMRSAYRGALEPIVASGLTVILGLLCLLLSDLSSLKGLGPVGALGIAGAMLSSLTLLPAALLLLGRKAFWPYPPRYGSEHRDSKGIWGRVARLVGRRARIAWVTTFVILAACAAFVPTLNEDPVPQTELFLTEVDSVGAQGILDEHFDSDQSSPAIMLVPANRLAQAIEVAQASDGVADNGVASLPAGPPSGDGPPSRR